LKQANEGESLDVQRRQIEGYALMHGLTIIEVMVEEGVSFGWAVGDFFGLLKVRRLVSRPRNLAENRVDRRLARKRPS
jgi:hypothetical protein